VLLSVVTSPDNAAVEAAPIPLTARCSVGPLTAPPNRPRYTVDATFDPVTGRVSGHISILFTPDQSVDEVVLRLWPNGGVRDAAAPTMRVSNMTVKRNGATSSPVSFRTENPTTVTVPVVADSDNSVTVDADFVTIARGERNDRISLTRDKQRAFVAARFGSFLPVLAWEPGVGWNRTPPTNSGAEASMTATADWDVRMSFAGDGSEGLSILASGELVEDGHWTSTAQRDWAMSIGRWNASDGSLGESTVSLGPGRRTVKVTVAVASLIRESASSYRAPVVKAIRSLSNRYGDYPWPTYTLVISPGLKGGIEYPSFVMQGPGSTGRTTTHEVAHQWFYGLVGNDQGRDPWIDEGLTTWAEARTENTLEAFVVKPIPADAKGKAGKPMAFWDVHRSSYYRGVYVQTLQALAALGDADKVDCALQSLVTAAAFRVATRTDVMRALEAEFPSARKTLKPFGLAP
jgi:Peptidase family M1 domain